MTHGWKGGVGRASAPSEVGEGGWVDAPGEVVCVCVVSGGWILSKSQCGQMPLINASPDPLVYGQRELGVSASILSYSVPKRSVPF